MDQAPCAPLDVQHWQGRIQSALTRGLTAERDNRTLEADRRLREAEAFQHLRALFGAVVRPVFTGAVDILRQGGIDATVKEAMRDRPLRMRRCLEMALYLRRLEGKGAARLVICGIEGRGEVRAKFIVGPDFIGDGFTERETIAQLDDLSEELVGGLVATLVDMAFGNPG